MERITLLPSVPVLRDHIMNSVVINSNNRPYAIACKPLNSSTTSRQRSGQRNRHWDTMLNTRYYVGNEIYKNILQISLRNKQTTEPLMELFMLKITFITNGGKRWSSRYGKAGGRFVDIPLWFLYRSPVLVGMRT